MEGTPGAPPTCRAISLCLLASFHALIPDSFGPQNSPLRSCSTASPDGAPAFPPQNLPNRFSPSSSPSCSHPRRPHKAQTPLRTSSTAGSDARIYLFFSLSAVIVAVALLRRRAPGFLGRWGFAAAGAFPLPEVRARVNGPKCSQAREPRTVRCKFAGCWLGAGERGWRKVTGRNLHREAGSGEGVGGGCQTQKRGERKGTEVLFLLRKAATFLGFQKNKK